MPELTWATIIELVYETSVSLAPPDVTIGGVPVGTKFLPLMMISLAAVLTTTL
jgi:hypothetical protein